MTGHTNEKSPNDYDEGNKREHRELSHITYQQNSTVNNIKQFPRIFSVVFSNQYETDPESKQSKAAMSHHAFTVNNFHNCQVTFSVIESQCGSPKSSDQHYCNYLFEVTITEQSRTFHRLTNFSCSQYENLITS